MYVKDRYVQQIHAFIPLVGKVDRGYIKEEGY